mmetsp:Transcript_53946/g.115863  ORF Transcript_53946/g.115863 Transcript_53946/m.115863 type:complete len:135 (+) Transcript_53946:1301-1705(+)
MTEMFIFTSLDVLVSDKFVDAAAASSELLVSDKLGDAPAACTATGGGKTGETTEVGADVATGADATTGAGETTGTDAATRATAATGAAAVTGDAAMTGFTGTDDLEAFIAAMSPKCVCSSETSSKRASLSSSQP